MSAPLAYTVATPEPTSHLFHVTLTVPDAPPVMRLLFPRWTPGSYLIREHGRQAERVRVRGDGEITKISPHQWEARTRGGSVTIEYRVYAHELTVRTAHLDDTHGFFNGVNLFLVPEGQENRACTLRITAPNGWKISTTLPQQKDGTFTADDFHHLVDCPVEMGTHRVYPFTVRGVPHELIFWNHGNEDPERLVQDLPKIVEQNAKVFGGLPYQRYLFITHLTDSGRGGLEHRDSTALLYPRFGFRPDKEYEDFLTLCTHEHFHTWNVKRIKPKVFAPYDYGKENATRMLWAMEGFTSYYDNFNTHRAGLLTSDRYLTAVGELATALLHTPGRKAHTLEESSFDAWIKYYRQDEHSVNSTVSYYLKGELVALCLDLTIRHATDGKRSLDDVMRLLWKWTGERGEGLDEDAVEHAAAEVAGRSLQEFFDLTVRTTEDLPLAECFAYVGIDVHTRAQESADDKGGVPARTGRGRPYFGATVRKDGSIANVVPQGPAARAGIAPGDQLVAIGGFRAADGNFGQRLEELKPGTVTVHFFRRDVLRSVEVALEEAPRSVVYLKRRENADARALELRKGWLSE